MTPVERSSVRSAAMPATAANAPGDVELVGVAGRARRGIARTRSCETIASAQP